MHEDFKSRHIWIAVELRHLSQRGFTCQYDALDSETGGELHAFRRRDRHLRRSVNFQAHAEFTRQNGDAQILNEDGVDAGLIEHDQLALGIGQLVSENKYVQRAKGTHVVLVEKPDQLRQLFVGEIVGAHPRVEPRQAEIHCVRSVGDGGACALHITGGSDQFWLMSHAAQP